jgi:hypothetical protein
MEIFYISILLLFAVFGAFCFNAGHKRAYRVVLKALLKGQIDFVNKKMKWLEENQGSVTQTEFAKCCISYQSVGQLVLGWYRYFANVRNDSELRILKKTMTQTLEKYLAALETMGNEKNLTLDI